MLFFLIYITALALLVLVVVGAFFISGFGSAGASVQIVNATQAECQQMCQALTTMAYNYDVCGDDYGEQYNTVQACTNTLKPGLRYTSKACEYHVRCAPQFGTCTVTLSNGATCRISPYVETTTT